MTRNSIPLPDAINTDGIVIVGAGPAGIVCALELADRGIPVILLESGIAGSAGAAQSLAQVDTFNPSVHADMTIATSRQVGGATAIWGGRCVPFDPIDFKPRAYVPRSEWPISYNDVQAYHQRTCDYFRCGRAIFSSHSLPCIKQKTITPNLPDGDVLSSELERWSLPTHFGREYGTKLRRHPRIRLLTGQTAIGIRANAERGEVSAIECSDLHGNRLLVSGESYIVACGGLETTRLLLQPTSDFPQGLGNAGGWLGRCYMGHISGQIADVQFHGDAGKTQFGFLRDVDGVYLRQRFTLSEETQLRVQANNAALWLVNPKIGNARHGNGVLSFAYLALSSRFGRPFASEAIRESAISDSSDSTNTQHAMNMLRQLPRTLAFVISFGIRRFLMHRKIPGFFQFSKSNCYPIHYHAEQVPNWDSRVWLSDTRDRLGMFKLNVDLKYHQQDVDTVIRIHAELDRWLRQHGAGRLKYHVDDLPSAIWSQARDGYHQAGTTRMSARPEDGVVDENCRVHGLRNLYVASSSNFVTSGQANSTFLILALALRLSDYLVQMKLNK